METSIYYAFQSHQIPTVFQRLILVPLVGWWRLILVPLVGWWMNIEAGFLFKNCIYLYYISVSIYIYISFWGSGGWGCVRSTLRLRPQPSATVRSRSQPFAWEPCGRAYGKFCRRGHFWRFQTSRCFVSRGRRGTSWHSDVFCNVSKVVLCGRPNTFATFS